MPLAGLERLGREAPPAVLCLQGLVAFLYLLDVSDVVYFPTIHRRTYTLAFDLGFDPYPALLVASGFWAVYMLSRGWRKEAVFCLIPYLFSSFSLEGSVAMNVMACSAMTIYKYGYREEAVKWLLRILIGFYSLALVHWLVLYPLGLNTGLVFFADLEIKLYHLGTYLSPLLVVFLLVVLTLRPILGKTLGEKRALEKDHVENGRRILIFALVLGFVSAIYPYLPAINPIGSYIGVDATNYQVGLKSVEENIMNIFSILNGDRPFLFLTLRVFQVLTFSSSTNAVKFFPVILIPSLSYSTYYFVKKVCGNTEVAGWSAFFVVTGIKVVVGLYSYYLSNLLGLVLIQLSLGLLFDSIENGSKARLVTSSLLAALCLYTHPWTFDQYIIGLLTVTGFLLILKIRRRESFTELRSLGVFFIFLVFAELLKLCVFKEISGSTLAYSTFFDNILLDNFWHSIIFSLRLKYGGYLSNIVPIVLSILGIKILISNDFKQHYLTVFQFLTMFGFLIGNEAIKSRLFYNIPLEYFASLGFIWLLLKFKTQNDDLTRLIIVISIVYLFRSIANIIII
jgi:hypothetical protein